VKIVSKPTFFSVINQNSNNCC